MKKITIYLLCIPVMLLIALKPHGDNRNSSQAPLGRTGAPNESTCGACHGGGSYSGEILFQLNQNGHTEYQPGTTYTVNFEADYGAPRYGFSITALDAANQPAGDFSITNQDNTSFGSLANGRQYVGHKSADGTNQWSFEWTAPDTDVGNITFYYVINAANGDGGTGGDFIQTGTTMISPAEEEELFTLTLEANPANAGHLSGECEYEAGESVTITAQPNEGYEFINWTDTDGTEVSNEESFVFTMPAEDTTLMANFAFSTFTLTFQVENEAGDEIMDAVILLDGTVYDPGQYVFEDLPPGTYPYTVSRDGFFDNSGTVTIADEDKTITVVLVEDDTSITETYDPQITIYPNPASSVLHIMTDNTTIGEVRLLDMLGNVIYSSNINENGHTIDVTGYRHGIYFIQVYSENQVFTFRVQIAG